MLFYKQQPCCRVALPKFHWNGGDVYGIFYFPGFDDFWNVYTGIADVHFSEQEVKST